jgi:hypothetical protein
MANLDETGAGGYNWEEEGVYQLEITDRVMAGAGGIANRQATDLAKRTRNLHDRLSTAETQKASLNSPAFSGTPTAPTPTPGTNTQQVASTAFVQAAIAALVDSSPGALDTLNELAAALNDDPNFATTITNALAGKAPLSSPAFSGTPTAPTAAAGTNNSQVATTAYVLAAIASGTYTLTKAAVESVLTGNITSHTHSSYLTAITKAMVEGVLTGTITSHNHNGIYEPVFSKKTAFNKAFGSASGTVCQGNDSRLTNERTPTNGSVHYAKVSNNLKNYATLSSGNVVLSANGGGNITLVANTAFSFSSFELNKNYLLTVEANGFTPSFADGSKHDIAEGSADLGNEGTFYISLTCTNATAGSEKLLTTIMKKKV